LAALLMVGPSCSTDPDNVGVCDEDLDGEIYYLQALNFTNSRIRISVDGRLIGEVAPYDSANHVPGFQDLQNFPQCSNATIYMGGSEAIWFTEIEWTREALELFQDGCALEIHLREFEEEYPEDWIEWDMRLPASYGDVADRELCQPWEYYFEIDSSPATGTPTPTDGGFFRAKAAAKSGVGKVDGQKAAAPAVVKTGAVSPE